MEMAKAPKKDAKLKKLDVEIAMQVKKAVKTRKVAVKTAGEVNSKRAVSADGCWLYLESISSYSAAVIK